jgi:hypothetical protein
VQRAAAASDERTAALAGETAIDLAPRGLKKRVAQQVELLGRQLP